MKNNWKYEIVNNQEDEDGYSHYPDNDINYESAKGKQNINANKITANTEPGSAKLVSIFPEAKRRISEFMNSPSAKLAVQSLPAGMEVAAGTMGKQKNRY